MECELRIDFISTEWKPNPVEVNLSSVLVNQLVVIDPPIMIDESEPILSKLKMIPQAFPMRYIITFSKTLS